MKRRLAVGMLTLLTAVIASGLVSGCAYRRSDRSLVQPLALSKKQFTGEWYYMKTVDGAPYDSGFFIGQGGWPLGSKIRWEVTERYLYAFHTSPNVRNTKSEVTPVAAWPIMMHFDIKRQINYRTGEPSNIIVEEMRDGTPWYDRKYMRVIWERMAMNDFTDIFQTYYKWIGRIRSSPAINVPPQEFKIVDDDNDGSSDYMTFKSEEVITRIFDSYYNMWVLEIPMTSHRVTIRHSFKKVKPSTYTPKEYTDEMFEKFGMFRTTILRYHPDRAIVDWSYKYYLNRHNLATKKEIDAGTKKPKKLVYYLSPGFPKELMDAVKSISDNWNEALAYGLGRSGKGEDRVFEILPNDWNHKTKKSDPSIRRELGDLRYNFLWWVNSPQAGSPLGYGPSVADSDTGEIVYGCAHIYGAWLRLLVDRYMTYYDMINGRYKDVDVTNGLDYLNTVYGLSGSDQLLALATGSKQSGLTARLKVQAPKPHFLNTKGKILARLRSSDFLSRMNALKDLTQTGITSRLARLDDRPEFKALLNSDYVAALAFPGVDPSNILGSTDKDVRKTMNMYHPADLAKPHKMREHLEKFLLPSYYTMYMADYADQALSKFVEYHKNTPREELRKRIMHYLFLSVTTHELGHTVGMAHNFTGSNDVFNYHNPYFALKKCDDSCETSCASKPQSEKFDCKKTCLKSCKATGCSSDQCPPDMQHKDFYMNASIMDYAGEYYNDMLGLGKYDKAAMAFTYGGLVEKAVKDPTKQGELIPWSMDVERKHKDPSNPLKLRNFKYCSDYYVGQDPFCKRFDAGANAREIVQHAIDDYDRNYLLRYWRRGRRSFGPYGAFYRTLRHYQHIAGFYQDWTYRVVTQPGYRDAKPEPYQDKNDFNDKLEAIQKGYNFFLRVIATPRVGAHYYTPELGVYEYRYRRDTDHKAPMDIKLGEGRFFYSAVQDGYYGIFRYRRTGTLYDKWLALLSMSARSWGYRNNSINWIFTNFYDLFQKDTTDLFLQGISSIWKPESKMLFCKEDKDKKCQPLEPGWHPFLQYNSMLYALALLGEQYTDQTFSDYMRIGTSGSGKSWTPPPGAKTVSCTNYHGTRTYFAVQSRDGNSASYRMVNRCRELAEELRLLNCCTPGVSRAEIERKQSELELIETTLTYMQYFVSVFEG